MNNFVENFECFGGNNRIKSKKESIGIDYFMILSDGKSFHVSNTLRFEVLQVVHVSNTLRFEVLQVVLFSFRSQNRIPNDALDEFKLLCSVTSTGTPKKEVCFFFKFSVLVFLVVSTNNVPFFNFLTDLAVPIIDSICFSITNGESEVTVFLCF